ncbi:50S ribosomal protein L32 [Candidatus Hepatincolaceae symbiont of Richtersius coronifer]
MAVPKKKTSKSRKNMRRSHMALAKNSYTEDKKTGQLHRPHHIDELGMYNGKQILNLKKDDLSN